MHGVLARLVFLAFLAMSGGIVYNALYLQDLRGIAVLPPAPAPASLVASAPAPKTASLPPASPQASPTVEVTAPPVSTDLPPLTAENGGSQLVVRAVQRELAARGYDVGEQDGTHSVKTRAAISTFESREGLPVTGIASDDLLHHILLGGGVKPEDAEPAAAASAPTSSATPDDAVTVMAVQQILADLGYDPGPADGAMGDTTASAISAFQHDRNVPETGQITPELLDELKRVTGRDLTKTAAKP